MIDPPRIELARLPTPIDHLQDLSQELGVEIYVKRDDLTGAVLSGNKVRKLEYELAAALERNTDVVITCGGAQSNHCRATAVAARRVGLDVELFLRGAHDAPVDGNLFLSLLMGATVHPVDDQGYAERDARMKARAQELAAQGREARVIPEGASTPLGCLGYVRAIQEIRGQEVEGDLTFDHLFVAVGSGGTLAGCVAGARLHGFQGRIVGIPVCDNAAHFHGVTQALLEQMAQEYFPGLDTSVPPDLCQDGFVGEGYGKATFDELERIRDVAVLTGLVLDPVYTNKAFGALLGAIRDRRIRRGERVLFIHTGGVFGLFPFRDRMPHLMVP